MPQNFLFSEDVVANELFQAWYFKSDEAKAAEWESWLQGNPPQNKLVNEAVVWMDKLLLAEMNVPEKQVEAAVLKLINTIVIKEQKQARTRRIKRRLLWLWIGSVIIAILATGVFLWVHRGNSTELKSGAGELSAYKLQDSSDVVLGHNSTLTLSGDWEGHKDREVWIKGEGSFHVKKDPGGSRFIVHTDGFDVIATGTRFTVVNRNDTNNVRLTEGSLFVHTKDGRKINMEPGDFVEAKKEIEKKVARPKKGLDWSAATLDFNETSLNEVVHMINEHYGVHVKLGKGDIGDLKITATLPNDSLGILLDSLVARPGLRVIRKKDRITIAKQKNK